MCECTVVYNIGGSRGVFFWGNLSLACIFPCPVPPCSEAAPKVCWSAQPQALPASSPNRQTFFLWFSGWKPNIWWHLYTCMCRF